jgi:hypothetical protein
MLDNSLFFLKDPVTVFAPIMKISLERNPEESEKCNDYSSVGSKVVREDNHGWTAISLYKGVFRSFRTES